MKTIFQPFQQAREGLKRGGAGLGLNIARQLITLMGGHLAVASTPQNGSRFYFALDLPSRRQVPSQVHDEPSDVFAIGNGRAVRAMVIDDVPANRAVLADMLGQTACAVTSAAGGAEALQLLAATGAGHPSGTDRVAEVAARLGNEASLVVNVQGDEPEIEPATIDAVVECMEDSGFDMCTAATPFRPPSEAGGADPADHNLVKVVVSQGGRAMYFSRSIIPFQRDSAGGTPPAYYLHIGIYLSLIHI